MAAIAALAGCAGGQGSLVTAGDLSEGLEGGIVGGRSAIELTLGRSGRAISCAVRGSSGSSLLDERACNLHMARHRGRAVSQPAERYIERRVDWSRLAATGAAVAEPLPVAPIIAAIRQSGGRCLDIDLGRACLADGDSLEVTATAADFDRRVRARLGNPCGRPSPVMGGWRNGRGVAVLDTETLYLMPVGDDMLGRIVDSLCPRLWDAPHRTQASSPWFDTSAIRRWIVPA